MKNKLKAKVLLIPDAHHPFADMKAWNLALKLAKEFSPSNVVILGDFFDFYSVSDHLKNPEVDWNFRRELSFGRKRLRELEDATPNAMSRVFVQGNHEYRYERYLYRNAPQLVGVLNIRTLLGLDENGWEYVPYKTSFSIGELNITHDIGGAGRTAHLKAAQLYGNNIAIGHVHSAGISYTGTPGGKLHVGMSCGWLGDVDCIDYVHNDVVKATWMHGIGIAYVLDNGAAHCHFIPFVDNEAVLPIEVKVIT